MCTTVDKTSGDFQTMLMIKDVLISNAFTSIWCENTKLTKSNLDMTKMHLRYTQFSDIVILTSDLNLQHMLHDHAAANFRFSSVDMRMGISHNGFNKSHIT